MQKVLETYPGVFSPEEVEKMQEEMDRTTVPGETEEQRQERALSIIGNATLKQVMSSVVSLSAQAETAE